VASLALMFDGIGLAAFLVTLLILAVTPSRGPRSGVFTPSVKAVVMATWGVYVYVTFAKLADKIGPPALENLYESYVEILFPLLMLMSAYSAYAAQQSADLARSQRAQARSHAFMMGIVDAAPAGILFLDPQGIIGFANDTAKQVLELTEDDRGWFQAPWLTGYGPAAAFAPLTHPEPQSNVPITLTGSAGSEIVLSVSTQLSHDAAGNPTGIVATFERPR
jgi:PAS domain-containing protein